MVPLFLLLLLLLWLQIHMSKAVIILCITLLKWAGIGCKGMSTVAK